MTRRRRSTLALGLLVSCIFPINSASSSETVNYTYDARGRLSNVSRSGSINNRISACYSYDKSDNRTNVIVGTSDLSAASGVMLCADQSVRSSDGRFLLVMQTDGNLVLYGSGGAYWSTATNGGSDRRMVMQADGNLVVYNGVNQALWHSNTYGNPGARLSLQNDGNLVITSTLGAVLWSAYGGSGGGPVTFSISNDGPVIEGNPSAFKITKSGTATGSLQVSYATANGSATAPGDYTALPVAVLTFATTDTVKTVNVATIDNGAAESPETFSMTLSSPSGGATIGTGTATATINDNDVPPPCSGISFKITSDGLVVEGGTETFTITKTGTTGSSCDVYYATSNGTATAGSDYVAKSSTKLTFTSAQSSQNVSVITLDDAAVENSETFTMSLSNPSGGATLGTPSSVVVTIGDNDSEPPPEQCYDEGGRPIPCD